MADPMAPETMRLVFRCFVDTANDFAARPRFYDTLTANRTTVVLDLACRVQSGIPIDARILYGMIVQTTCTILEPFPGRKRAQPFASAACASGCFRTRTASRAFAPSCRLSIAIRTSRSTAATPSRSAFPRRSAPTDVQRLNRRMHNKSLTAEAAAILTNSFAAGDVGLPHAGYAPYRRRLLAGGGRKRGPEGAGRRKPVAPGPRRCTPRPSRSITSACSSASSTSIRARCG